jgi:hypothetical protein
VQYLVGVIGLVGILRTRRLARRRLAEEGVVIRPIRQILAERRGLSVRRTDKGQGFDRDAAVEAFDRKELSTVNQRRT